MSIDYLMSISSTGFQTEIIYALSKNILNQLMNIFGKVVAGVLTALITKIVIDYMKKRKRDDGRSSKYETNKKKALGAKWHNKTFI